MVLGENSGDVFFFIIIIIIIVFLGILLKSHITPFELSVKLEDAYFAKKLLMFDFGILAYSET